MMLLFWKEWREMRLLPVLALATYIALFLAEASCDRFSTGEWQSSPEFMNPLIATWLIFWTVAGSTAFSSEIGSGSLQFMSVIPVSRRRIWWVKLSVAFFSAVAVFAVTIAFVQMLYLYWPGSSIAHAGRLNNSVWPMNLYWALLVSGSLLVCLSSGFCASPFFDQPIVSTVVAAIGGVIYFAFSTLYNIGRIYHYHGNFYYLGALIVTALLIMPPLVTSYQTFVRGESLKSIKRYKVGALTFIGTSVVSTIIYALLTKV